MRQTLITVVTYLGITAATLAAVDVACNVLGVFPPPVNYGNMDVGWLGSKTVSPTMFTDRCTQLSGTTVEFQRNEDGVRTSYSSGFLLADHGHFKIADTGDSQTDLCAPNAEVHSGVLETELNARGVKAIVLPYGVGRYSPLQDYLVYRKILKKYSPDALVINFYTGNDFSDLLRVDDRPHFVKAGGQYQVADPVWYTLDDPRVHRRSRVLSVLRSLLEATGVSNVILHVEYLSKMAREQGEGIPAVLAYMNDLRKANEPSLAYSEAFSAQFLGQQLFFHRFPAAREESLRRARALLQLARRENPNLLLIVSALPSYELVQQRPVDSALARTLARLPVTYDGGVQEEQGLYDALRQIAAEEGCLFVDNLTPLRAYRGGERLYNPYDYHLLPPASAIIGRAQADVLLLYRRAQHASGDGAPRR